MKNIIVSTLALTTLLFFSGCEKSLSTPEKREEDRAYYWSLKNELDAKERERKENQEALQNARDELNSFILDNIDESTSEETQENTLSFYSWLGSVLNIDPNMLSFIISLIPALLVDITLPFGTALITFSFSKKENNKQ